MRLRMRQAEIDLSFEPGRGPSTGSMRGPRLLVGWRSLEAKEIPGMFDEESRQREAMKVDALTKAEAETLATAILALVRGGDHD